MRLVLATVIVAMLVMAVLPVQASDAAEGPSIGIYSGNVPAEEPLINGTVLGFDTFTGADGIVTYTLHSGSELTSLDKTLLIQSSQTSCNLFASVTGITNASFLYGAGLKVTLSSGSTVTGIADLTAENGFISDFTGTYVPGTHYLISVTTIKEVRLEAPPASEGTFTFTFGMLGHTVTYHGNGNTGGTVPTDVNIYDGGSTATIAGNTGGLTKDGYTFSGWNTSADGSGTAHAVGSSVIMNGDLELYAQWVASGSDPSPTPPSPRPPTPRPPTPDPEPEPPMPDVEESEDEEGTIRTETTTVENADGSVTVNRVEERENFDGTSSVTESVTIQRPDGSSTTESSSVERDAEGDIVRESSVETEVTVTPEGGESTVTKEVTTYHDEEGGVTIGVLIGSGPDGQGSIRVESISEDPDVVTRAEASGVGDATVPVEVVSTMDSEVIDLEYVRTAIRQAEAVSLRLAELQVPATIAIIAEGDSTVTVTQGAFDRMSDHHAPLMIVDPGMSFAIVMGPDISEHLSSGEGGTRMVFRTPVVLTDEQREVIGDNRAVEITFMTAGVRVGDLGGMLEVVLDCEPPAEGYRKAVHCVHDDGTLEEMESEYGDGKLRFFTPHLSVFMVSDEAIDGSDGFPMGMLVGTIAVLLVAAVLALKWRYRS